MIERVCREAGLELTRDRIPVGPAAHYVMGGVETDLEGRTSIPGLFAAGEVACTRVHGANRLASNSLLEGVVFGARAAEAMAADSNPSPRDDAPPPAGTRSAPSPEDRSGRDELRASISESDVVLVFWCHHSFTSYDVRKECDLAVEQGKDMLPLLLDDTPLPRTLAGRRAIDWRARIGVMHEGSPDQQPAHDLAERTEVDRLIANDMARHYEELFIISLAREIETELAARLGRQ